MNPPLDSIDSASLGAPRSGPLGDLVPAVPALTKPPLSVADAQRLKVCRFCQLDDRPSPGNPLELHYGSEYAHRNCIAEANRLGDKLPAAPAPVPKLINPPLSVSDAQRLQVCQDHLRALSGTPPYSDSPTPATAPDIWDSATAEILHLLQQPWPTKTVASIVRDACLSYHLSQLKPGLH